MYTLTVDVGNTLTKFELWDDSGFVRSIGEEELKSLDVTLAGMIVSSVRKGGEDIEGLNILKERYGCPLILFNQEEIARYGSINRYEGNVGSDRFAAFLGVKAQSLPGASLIVDAGTALTIDICNDSGEYCGGNISLGLGSRLKALHSNTSLLPEVKIGGDVPPFGKNTVTAIESGAVNGVTGEIFWSIDRAKRFYGIKKVWVTGGDVRYFRCFLNEAGIEVEHDPHLVGRGLDHHLRNLCLNRND